MADLRLDESRARTDTMQPHRVLRGVHPSGAFGLLYSSLQSMHLRPQLRSLLRKSPMFCMTGPAFHPRGLSNEGQSPSSLRHRVCTAGLSPACAWSLQSGTRPSHGVLPLETVDTLPAPCLQQSTEGRCCVPWDPMQCYWYNCSLVIVPVKQACQPRPYESDSTIASAFDPALVYPYIPTTSVRSLATSAILQQSCRDSDNHCAES